MSIRPLPFRPKPAINASLIGEADIGDALKFDLELALTRDAYLSIPNPNMISRLHRFSISTFFSDPRYFMKKSATTSEKIEDATITLSNKFLETLSVQKRILAQQEKAQTETENMTVPEERKTEQRQIMRELRDLPLPAIETLLEAYKEPGGSTEKERALLTQWEDLMWLSFAASGRSQMINRHLRLSDLIKMNGIGDKIEEWLDNVRSLLTSGLNIGAIPGSNSPEVLETAMEPMIKLWTVFSWPQLAGHSVLKVDEDLREWSDLRRESASHLRARRMLVPMAVAMAGRNVATIQGIITAASNPAFEDYLRLRVTEYDEVMTLLREVTAIPVLPPVARVAAEFGTTTESTPWGEVPTTRLPKELFESLWDSSESNKGLSQIRPAMTNELIRWIYEIYPTAVDLHMWWRSITSDPLLKAEEACTAFGLTRITPQPTARPLYGERSGPIFTDGLTMSTAVSSAVELALTGAARQITANKHGSPWVSPRRIISNKALEAGVNNDVDADGKPAVYVWIMPDEAATQELILLEEYTPLRLTPVSLWQGEDIIGRMPYSIEGIADYWGFEVESLSKQVKEYLTGAIDDIKDAVEKLQARGWRTLFKMKGDKIVPHDEGSNGSPKVKLSNYNPPVLLMTARSVEPLRKPLRVPGFKASTRRFIRLEGAIPQEQISAPIQEWITDEYAPLLRGTSIDSVTSYWETAAMGSTRSGGLGNEAPKPAPAEGPSASEESETAAAVKKEE